MNTEYYEDPRIAHQVNLIVQETKEEPDRILDVKSQQIEHMMKIFMDKVRNNKLKERWEDTTETAK